MESNRNDKYWYVRLDDVPRAVKFPFPLKELGFFWNKVEPEASFDWKLEFTLRLSSLEQFAVDEIGGVTYRTEYPNVILKLPGVVHKYAVPEPRDAVYFAYSTALADAMTAANLFQMPPVWKIKLTPKICEMLERAKQLMEHSREYGVADRLDLLAFQLYEELLFSRHENSDFARPLHGIAHSAHRLLFPTQLQGKYRPGSPLPQKRSLQTDLLPSLETLFQYFSKPLSSGPAFMRRRASAARNTKTDQRNRRIPEFSGHALFQLPFPPEIRNHSAAIPQADTLRSGEAVKNLFPAFLNHEKIPSSPAFFPLDACDLRFRVINYREYQ